MAKELTAAQELALLRTKMQSLSQSMIELFDEFDLPEETRLKLAKKVRKLQADNLADISAASETVARRGRRKP